MTDGLLADWRGLVHRAHRHLPHASAAYHERIARAAEALRATPESLDDAPTTPVPRPEKEIP